LCNRLTRLVHFVLLDIFLLLLTMCAPHVVKVVTILIQDNRLVVFVSLALPALVALLLAILVSLGPTVQVLGLLHAVLVPLAPTAQVLALLHAVFVSLAPPAQVALLHAVFVSLALTAQVLDLLLVPCVSQDPTTLPQDKLFVLVALPVLSMRTPDRLLLLLVLFVPLEPTIPLRWEPVPAALVRQASMQPRWDPLLVQIVPAGWGHPAVLGSAALMGPTFCLPARVVSNAISIPTLWVGQSVLPALQALMQP